MDLAQQLFYSVVVSFGISVTQVTKNFEEFCKYLKYPIFILQKPASPVLPMKVVEKLETNNETTFYVLAPDTGVEEQQPEEKPAAEAFMTETPPVEEKSPSYINNVDVPAVLLKEVKERWVDQKRSFFFHYSIINLCI